VVDTVGGIGEFVLIQGLRQVVEPEGSAAAGAVLGVGDDAAARRPREGWDLLITCDALVEGQHYLPEYTTPQDLGRRAMAVNLSDIGAMGGQPRFALVSLGLRQDTAVAAVQAMYRGMVQELKLHGGTIIGGNVTQVEGAEFVDITLVGEVEAGRTVRRSTARVGDAVLVTGYPGQAAAGLRLLREKGNAQKLANEPLVKAFTRPQARAREGREAALSGWLSALIDTSDGFLGDLGHICEESGVGARLYATKLPLSEALRQAAASWEEEPVDLFLAASDDYELILVCDPERVEHIRTRIAQVSQVPVAQVGEIVEAAGGIVLAGPEGTERPLRARGWDHFARTGDE